MTTAASPTRREFIARRQQQSVVWRVIHAMGSLKLALLLLVTIGLACAIATFAESRFDTKVAQAYIYKAPWFTVWLGVLCANLFAVTLTRWPWQRHHLGFVITHYGIITLLVGAMVGSHFGFEGNVTLHRGAPPLDRITTSHSLLQIQNVATGAFTDDPFDAALARPSEARPKTFPVPDSDLRLVIDAQSEHLIWDQRLVPDDSPSGQPGIAMNFDTRLMGQHVSLPFTLIEGSAMTRDFFGLAKIIFAPALPPPPAADLIVESQIVFAKFSPVIQSESDAVSGVRLTLAPDGSQLHAALPDGTGADFDRAKILSRDQKLGDVTFTVAEYWPDFALVDGRPTTASAEPKNPAVLVRLRAPHPPRPGVDLRPRLTLAPTADGIAYQVIKKNAEIARGTAKVGETFPLGWADWAATLAQSLPKSRLASERIPAPDDQPGVPGLRAHLVAPDGARGPAQWIASGDNPTLAFRSTTARIGYGLEQRPVPFEIRLKNFEVPRLEGTQTPANFIATVEFRAKDGKEWSTDVAQMNHPASWPGGAFALTTGLNYKFSQAQWNPEDLGETTLQVLYDPGWLFKWTGSLAIVAGIFTMFYLRPKKS